MYFNFKRIYSFNILAVIWFCLFTSGNIFAQSNVKWGIEVSPGIKFQTVRNKTTGLFSSLTGYGFNTGVSMKYHLNDDKTISTGLLYDFIAFDTRVNSTLINALRLNALNVPLVYNHPFNEHYFINAGGGINYIFSSKEFGTNAWNNVNGIVNQIQPYLSLGGSLLKDKEAYMYEIGISAKYQVLSLWSLNTLTSTNIASIDLNLKFFF